MPIFGFTCQACGTTFEQLVRSSSAVSEVVCQECGSQQVRKLLSRVARTKVNGGSPVSSSAASAANCAPGGG